jgi:hypothetical protein
MHIGKKSKVYAGDFRWEIYAGKRHLVRTPSKKWENRGGLSVDAYTVATCNLIEFVTLP